VATSAKRLGLEVKGDLELELRLRRIETELEKRLLANPDATATSRARSTPPQVTGIRVTGSTPGAVTIAWNATPIPDLRRYDVEFAEDTAFVTNKQTFREGGTSFQFSTASATGGAGGTTFFARVRAVNSILQPGPYSVVLNTATGEVVSGDIADGAIDTAQIADGAVTGAKTSGLVTDLTLPGPPFLAGDADKYLRINSAATSYTVQTGTLPNLASGVTNRYARVTGTDIIGYQAGTLPSEAAVGDVNKYARVTAADTIGYQAGTLPAAAAAGDINSIAIVTAADVIGYFSQAVQNEAAATDGGNDGVNRQGTLVFPGGLKIQWETVSTSASTTAEFPLPEAYTGDHYNVVAVYADDTSGATAGNGLSAWVPAGANHLTHVEIRNDFDVALAVTFVSIGSD
jgi:hypothetical protein